MVPEACAFVFSLNSPSAPARQQVSVVAKDGRFEGKSAPVSQTLIVLSSDPVTILVPSGENATELMRSLWALVFSLSASSLPDRQASRRQFGQGGAILRPPVHQIPRL